MTESSPVIDPAPPPPVASGAVIGGYRVEALLGRGGMGVVYRAEQIQLGRPVALKLMAPEVAQDPGIRQRFIAESRLAAAIDHPNILPLYEAGVDAEVPFIATRLVEGIDLKELLVLEGPLAPERALAIAGQVAAALDAAHARGLVARRGSRSRRRHLARSRRWARRSGSRCRRPRPGRPRHPRRRSRS